MSFFERYPARRVGGEWAPDLFGLSLTDGPDDAEPAESGTIIERDYECSEPDWTTFPVAQSCPKHWPQRPRRFVDGRDLGRTIAWIEAPDGLPVPLRLAQIGAAVLRAEPQPAGGARLTLERRVTQSVVALAANRFPWRDIEAFSVTLAARGYRLLVVKSPETPAEACDFAGLANSAKSRTTRMMFEMEQRVTHPVASVPTVLDGILNEKIDAIHQRQPIVAVAKTHGGFPLHSRGIQTLARLGPCERTPAFLRKLIDIDYVSWYLRLGDGAGDPSKRVVRVEICRVFFEEIQAKNFGYIDTISRALCDIRATDGGYKRAATTLHPIQRAEELIRAGFHTGASLENRFCNALGIG